MFALAHDITERMEAEARQKQLEASNLRLQKAESLGQMAGGIAHLFNNYLCVVTGNLEMALEDLPDDSLVRHNLIGAMNAARRSSDVSGAMLTYLGQTIVKPEFFNISEFCLKNLSGFQSLSHIGITIEAVSLNKEMIVSANASHINQILTHLITNACESIGKNKGKINIVIKRISASDIAGFHTFPVGCKPSSDTYACLEVSDTGYGIPEEDIDRIFDPFFTTKFTGRGLGLAIVLGIVKTWGGMIGVRSQKGHGSSFMVFLPLSEKTSAG